MDSENKSDTLPKPEGFIEEYFSWKTTEGVLMSDNNLKCGPNGLVKVKTVFGDKLFLPGNRYFWNVKIINDGSFLSIGVAT